MEEAYWNKYYSNRGRRAAPNVPSQFAAFVANEFAQSKPLVVDVGCGNGRDTHFFAHCGFSAIGIDAAEQAIAGCQLMSKEMGNLEFICAPLGDAKIAEAVKDRSRERRVLLYARFFLHAINDGDEAEFFELARAICGEKGAIAVEFRTNKDKALAKVTDTHYRRFIDPLVFLERANARGFRSDYFSEGFGFAKFKDDDAHTARFLLSASSVVTG